MKKTILATALVAAAASAQADTKLYGQVAYNIVGGDSDLVGAERDYEFTRHGFSETRYGIMFTKKVGSLTWLANQEFGVNDDGGNSSRPDVRRQVFGVKGGFGKIQLGYHGDVGDGVLHADLAGTASADPMSSSSAGAAGEVQNNDDGDGDINVNGFDPDEGESLQYYSPKLGGIATIGVQLQEQSGFELAWKLNAAGFRFYGFYEDNGDEDSGGNTDGGYANNAGVLLGYKAPFGLSITGVVSTSEADTAGGSDDTDHAALKLGYGFGKNKLSVKFQTREESSGDETEEVVLAYMHSPAKGVDLWAVIKDAESDITGDTDDGTAFGIGGRVKF